MPYTLDGADYTKTWHLVCNDPATVENPLLAQCLALAATLNALVPVDNIEILLLPPPDVDSYSYIIKLEDGRKWSQIVRMDNVTDPLMNWKHNSFWRKSEFDKVVPLRSKITETIQSIHPTEMTITFL